MNKCDRETLAKLKGLDSILSKQCEGTSCQDCPYFDKKYECLVTGLDSGIRHILDSEDCIYIKPGNILLHNGVKYLFCRVRDSSYNFINIKTGNPWTNAFIEYNEFEIKGGISLEQLESDFNITLDIGEDI